MSVRLDDEISNPVLRLKRLGAEVFWVSAGQGLALAGGIVGVYLLAHALPPASYGKISLAMTVALLAQQIAFGPIGVAGQRFYVSALERNELGALWEALKQLVGAALAMIATVGLVMVAVLLSMGAVETTIRVAAAIAVTFPISLNLVLVSLQTAARHRRAVAMIQAAEQWLRFLVALVLLHALSTQESAVAILGYAIGTLIVLLGQWWPFSRSILAVVRAGPQLDRSTVSAWRSKLVRLAWPFALMGALVWVQAASERWALQIFAGSDSVGRYAVLYQVGFFPMSIFVANFVTQFAGPILFGRAGDASHAGRMHNVRKLTLSLVAGMVAMTVVVTAFAVAFHDVLFSIFMPADYHAVSYLLAPMTLAGGLFACGQTLNLLPIANAETRDLLMPRAGTAVFSLLAHMVGAAQFGVPGVVWAVVAGCALYAVLMLRVALREPRA